MRVWRGDDGGGALQDYTVEVNEGEVVLDIIHRLQQTQAGDLAVRWNCKAGKCGSCSAEINGRPRLLCMTRMSTFGEDEVVTVTPLRTFPVIRDLVTDVSFNYEKAREIPSFTPPKDLQPGEYRMAAGGRQPVAGVPQVHRVLPVPERLPRDSRPRGEQAGVRRSAVPHAHGRTGHASARHRGSPRPRPRTRTASACCNITKCCTEVCPEHIKITDNAIIPMKERVAGPPVRPGGVARQQAVPATVGPELVDGLGSVGSLHGSGQSTTKGSTVILGIPHSINDIRTAIRELSARADLARKEGRPDDAAELERAGGQGYREELGARP